MVFYRREGERSDPERGREEGDYGDREASLRVERRGDIRMCGTSLHR